MIKEHPFDCGHYIIGGYLRAFSSDNEFLMFTKQQIDTDLKKIPKSCTAISGTFLKSQDHITNYLKTIGFIPISNPYISKYNRGNPLTIWIKYNSTVINNNNKET